MMDGQGYCALSDDEKLAKAKRSSWTSEYLHKAELLPKEERASCIQDRVQYVMLFAPVPIVTELERELPSMVFEQQKGSRQFSDHDRARTRAT